MAKADAEGLPVEREEEAITIFFFFDLFGKQNEMICNLERDRGIGESVKI